MRKNMKQLLRDLTADQLRKEPDCFEIGDTVKVHQKVVEGSKTRIQVFQGTVISRKHGGVHESFTVRKISNGVGVEKIYPLHSPRVDKIEIVRHGKIRRAKLYFLRDRIGKAQRLKDRIVLKKKDKKEQNA